jgi:hypothetical protein
MWLYSLDADSVIKWHTKPIRSTCLTHCKLSSDSTAGWTVKFKLWGTVISYEFENTWDHNMWERQWKPCYGNRNALCRERCWYFSDMLLKHSLDIRAQKILPPLTHFSLLLHVQLANFYVGETWSKNQLTALTRFLLGKLIVAQLVKNSLPYMEQKC